MRPSTRVWRTPGAAAKRCTHPWVYCLINHAGKVGFCDHLIGAGTERYLLGDLLEETFEAIWNGRAYQELRRQHLAWSDGLDERFENATGVIATATSTSSR